jgi:hypothetical protein
MLNVLSSGRVHGPNARPKLKLEAPQKASSRRAGWPPAVSPAGSRLGAVPSPPRRIANPRHSRLPVCVTVHGSKAGPDLEARAARKHGDSRFSAKAHPVAAFALGPLGCRTGLHLASIWSIATTRLLITAFAQFFWLLAGFPGPVTKSGAYRDGIKLRVENILWHRREVAKQGRSLRAPHRLSAF